MRNREIVYSQRQMENKQVPAKNRLDRFLEKGRMLFVLLSVYSVFWCLTSGLELAVYKGVWLIVVVNVIVLTYLLHVLKKKFTWSAWISIPAFLLSYALVFYYYMEEFMQGFYYVAIRIYGLVKTYYRVSLSEPIPFIEEVLLMHEEAYYLTFFIAMVSVLVVAIVSMVFYNGMNSFYYLLYTAPFVILPFALGRVPNSVSFVLYITMTMVVVAGNRKQKKLKDTGIQNRVMMVMAIYCFVCVSLVYLAYPEKTYLNTMDLKQTKKDFQKKVTELSKIKLFSDMTVEQWLKYNFSQGINYGKLGNSDEIQYKNDTVLKVQMNSHTLGRNATHLYLRGYVGEVYKSDHWENLSSEGLPEYDKDLEELLGKGIHKEDVNLMLLQYLDTVSGASTSSHYSDESSDLFSTVVMDEELHIKNVAAGRGRAFLPYFSNTSYSIDEKGRIQLENGEGEDGVQYFPKTTQAIKKWMIEKEEGTGYLQYWRIEDEEGSENEIMKGIRSINQFTEKYYLTVPDNVKAIGMDHVMNQMANALSIDLEEEYRKYHSKEYETKPSVPFVIEEFIEGGEVKKSFVSNLDSWNEEMKGFVKELSKKYLGDMVKMVQQCMWSRTGYTLSPGRTPTDKDFVDYFLFENKKGYCVHYATTAVLLFRTLGIPARMVEGYVLSPETVSKAKNQSKAEKYADEFIVDVKDNNAHAWVEIYIEYLGWIPIEVTPSSGLGSDRAEPQNTPSPNKDIANNQTVEKNRRDENPIPTPSTGDGKEMEKRYSGRYGKILQAVDHYSKILALPGSSLVILTIALLYLILIILSMRRRMYNVYQTKVLPKKNTRKRVAFLYHRIALAFRLYGVSYDGQSIDRYAEQLMEEFNFLELTDAKSAFLERVFQSVYGRNPITEEEYQELEGFYKLFCSRICEMAKPWKRWYMKNILCLF